MSSEEHKNLTDSQIIEIIEKKAETRSEKVQVWRSCCFQTDPHMCSYIGQLSTSFLILGFSFIMLIKANGSCEQSSPYIGLISFLLGKLLSSVMSST